MNHGMFFHGRGKDEIRQNGKAQPWNGIGSEFSFDIPIDVLELNSEGIRYFRRKKEPRNPDFVGDCRIEITFNRLNHEGGRMPRKQTLSTCPSPSTFPNCPGSYVSPLFSGHIDHLSYRAMGAWAPIYVSLAIAPPEKPDSGDGRRPSCVHFKDQTDGCGRRNPILQAIEGQKIRLEFWDLSGDETYCGLMLTHIRKA